MSQQQEFCYEDSPYVVQTQSAFTLDVDLTLSELYCNLAKDWMRVHDVIDPRLQTWGVEFDTKLVPDTCFDGRSRGEIGLEYITQMWDAYDSRPKFAFLNALAAHDYSVDSAHASLSAENYDAVVHRFLTNIMARNDSRDTYIILRSDHGLQGESSMEQLEQFDITNNLSHTISFRRPVSNRLQYANRAHASLDSNNCTCEPSKLVY